ncbi:GL27370, isoform B [Drosophila persimilis]|uniref:GL27370, isoform B n=1 Tax=Drosophila persimilis TaxID=7234 RepID=B4GF61_DROPE|nr:GL27370, isoform B [Drosophila persimilis]
MFVETRKGYPAPNRKHPHPRLAGQCKCQYLQRLAPTIPIAGQGAVQHLHRGLGPRRHSGLHYGQLSGEARGTGAGQIRGLSAPGGGPEVRGSAAGGLQHGSPCGGPGWEAPADGAAQDDPCFGSGLALFPVCPGQGASGQRGCGLCGGATYECRQLRLRSPAGACRFLRQLGQSAAGLLLARVQPLEGIHPLCRESAARPGISGPWLCVSEWQQLTRFHRCPRETGNRQSMGGDLANASMELLLARRQGVYYFETNAKPPYGMVQRNASPKGKHK